MNFEVINFNKKNIDKIIQNRISEDNKECIDFENHFKVGDLIIVTSKLIDADNKVKFFKFEGVCYKKDANSKKFFVQRKGAGEVLIYRNFNYFSSNIAKIEVIKKKKK